MTHRGFLPLLLLAAVSLVPTSARADQPYPKKIGFAVLRAHRQEAAHTQPLAGTPLPGRLRRVTHEARGLAGKALAGPKPSTIEVAGGRTSVAGNGTEVAFFVDGNGALQKAKTSREGAMPARIESDVLTVDGKRYVFRSSTKPLPDGRRVTRVENAVEAPGPVTLPSGRQVEKGQWAVMVTGSSRASLWSWRDTPNGRTRVKTTIAVGDYEFLDKLKAPAEAQLPSLP